MYPFNNPLKSLNPHSTFGKPSLKIPKKKKKKKTIPEDPWCWNIYLHWLPVCNFLHNPNESVFIFQHQRDPSCRVSVSGLLHHRSQLHRYLHLKRHRRRHGMGGTNRPGPCQGLESMSFFSLNCWNMFRVLCENLPEAIFYGHTASEFLYWFFLNHNLPSQWILIVDPIWGDSSFLITKLAPRNTIESQWTLLESSALRNDQNLHISFTPFFQG